MSLSVLPKEVPFIPTTSPSPYDPGGLNNLVPTIAWMTLM